MKLEADQEALKKYGEKCLRDVEEVEAKKEEYKKMISELLYNEEEQQEQQEQEKQHSGPRL